MAKGVFPATKKDGSIYYRSSITLHGKHISLGSFDTEAKAHTAYQTASAVIADETILSPDDYAPARFPVLSFQKWISLVNFKNNGIYSKTPIYLRKHFFQYFLSVHDVLIFDVDDLFYYSHHAIMRRGNHLFVSEYGMQTNIHSRYGIRNFARSGIDFRFVNGNKRDYRYSNIEVMNPYYGVTVTTEQGQTLYTTRIHLHGNYLVGRYSSLTESAIAYNKAVDYAWRHGCKKRFNKNYIESLSRETYLEQYDKIRLPASLLQALSQF